MPKIRLAEIPQGLHNLVDKASETNELTDWNQTHIIP